MVEKVWIHAAVTAIFVTAQSAAPARYGRTSDGEASATRSAHIPMTWWRADRSSWIRQGGPLQPPPSSDSHCDLDGLPLRAAMPTGETGGAAPGSGDDRVPGRQN